MVPSLPSRKRLSSSATSGKSEIARDRSAARDQRVGDRGGTAALGLFQDRKREDDLSRSRSVLARNPEDVAFAACHEQFRIPASARQDSCDSRNLAGDARLDDAEMRAGGRVTVTTQVLAGAGKKMHLFHRLLMADGTLAATVETLLLHVDMTTRRSAPPSAEVAGALGRFAEAHAGLPKPKGVGLAVGHRG